MADGTPGELAIAGTSRAVMFSGYLGVDGDPLEDGWYRTGDLVVRRPDGAIVFVDRMRDTIRRFGENISSVAVEAVVNADSEVSESAALASPSDVCGEEVLLVVTPATVDAAALFRRLQQVLPAPRPPRVRRGPGGAPEDADRQGGQASAPRERIGRRRVGVAGSGAPPRVGER